VVPGGRYELINDEDNPSLSEKEYRTVQLAVCHHLENNIDIETMFHDVAAAHFPQRSAISLEKAFKHEGSQADWKDLYFPPSVVNAPAMTREIITSHPYTLDVYWRNVENVLEDTLTIRYRFGVSPTQPTSVSTLVYSGDAGNQQVWGPYKPASVDTEGLFSKFGDVLLSLLNKGEISSECELFDAVTTVYEEWDLEWRFALRERDSGES